MSKDLGLPIGGGGQYTVYDAGDGRVLKVPNTLEEAQRVAERWSPDRATALASGKETLSYRDSNVPRVLRLVARYPHLGATLGNPRAESDGCFTQDWVRMLDDVFQESDRAAILASLQGYAECMLACWRYGIHDYLNQFDENNGLDNSGRVVFIDFGEVGCFTPFARENVQTRTLSRHFDEKTWLNRKIPEDLHLDFHRIIDERLSIDAFEETWSADLDDLDRSLLEGPILRERKQDIPELLKRLLVRSNRETGRQIDGFSQAAMEHLLEYPWDSPVLLDDVVLRAVESCHEDLIETRDIDLP